MIGAFYCFKVFEIADVKSSGSFLIRGLKKIIINNGDLSDNLLFQTSF